MKIFREVVGFHASTQTRSFTQTNRVVIDTNVFISALLNPLGTPKKVINIAVSQFTILQSEVTYQELVTRISKKKFDKY